MNDPELTPRPAGLDPSIMIKSYHAHVYFAADEVDRARALCEAAAARFDLVMGRVHERPIGPHPFGSCQLGCSPKVFAELLPWLALNRGGLTIFAHPETGDEVKDHRDHGIWLGETAPLDLSVFR